MSVKRFCIYSFTSGNALRVIIIQFDGKGITCNFVNHILKIVVFNCTYMYNYFILYTALYGMCVDCWLKSSSI